MGPSTLQQPTPLAGPVRHGEGRDAGEVSKAASESPGSSLSGAPFSPFSISTPQGPAGVNRPMASSMGLWGVGLVAWLTVLPPSFPPSVALRPPSELLVSSHASTTVVSLAWVSGPLGVHSLGTRRGSQLSEAGHLSWEHPLVPGQAHLILRGLIPGCNLSLSVLCQAGPLQASTHRVVLLVGMLTSAVGG